MSTTDTDRRARRRAAFLDAADEAIRRHGPGVTMADVAGAAGVTKPVLYRFIADKDDLASGLAERYVIRLQEILSSTTNPEAGPRGMLDRTIRAYLTFIDSEPEIYEFLVQRAPVESPNVAEHLQRFTHVLAGRITEVVTAELVREGRATDGAEAFAHGMIGMVQAAGDWWLARRSVGEVMTRDQLASHLVRVLWTGLSGLPPAAPAGAEGAAAGPTPAAQPR